MIVHVLACDYDGTVADEGVLSAETAAILARVRESGRKVFLVTGRMLDDLKSVCPDVDRIFDVVVAENGALLYLPERREIRRLGDAPEVALIEALQRRGVPFDVGTAILATTAAYSDAALAAIRETGVERTLVFNKGALMLLPGGVTKGTGLTAALDLTQLSPRNLAGVGDAENDHAFLSMCECACAVADAVPALQERADVVSQASGAGGAREFAEQHVLRDLVDLLPRLTRHEIGDDLAGGPVGLRAHGTHMLVVGPSASGKTSLTAALLEQLLDAGRSVCLLDPEGDYHTMSDVQHVLVMGGKNENALPTPDELTQLLGRPGQSLVLDLSAQSRAEKVTYATKVLATANAMRGTRGLPHWLVIDEAHHIFPADGSTGVDLLPHGTESFCLITLGVEELPREILDRVDTVASTDLDAFRKATDSVFGRYVHGLRLPTGAPLERGEAAIAWRDHEQPAVRIRVRRRRIEHRRHVRKYTEGELPADRSFFFRGPQLALNLRAANLVRFCELAEGVDEATWDHHLRQGDYSQWLRDMIKDPELADEVREIEQRSLAPAESRRRVIEAIRRKYTV
jgi:hydroxymethylpyrimidine pyrophosphatase-like HAD family hydrolase